MYIAILGRQPALSIAELERSFGGGSIKVISNQAAIIDANDFEINNFGGTLKAGLVIEEIQTSEWTKIHQNLIERLYNEWSEVTGKITLGISVYGMSINPQKIQQTGLILKRQLKKHGISLRLIPNQKSDLNTATSHHNKLGLSDNKVEIIIAKSGSGKVYIAKSCGSQNITAYANRDQKRPKRDAFVGMLPPKLAQIMINLTGFRLKNNVSNLRLLDPFCGTGVVLQEASLMNMETYGTDLSEKMVEYSIENLKWLCNRRDIKFKVEQGDATNKRWSGKIDLVVGETYLGQPFSAPPSSKKLIEVTGNCNHIIGGFLRNLATQIDSGTPVCIAVPAWRDKSGNFTHLPIIDKIANYGFRPYEFHHVSQNDMLYFREDQVVARELLVLVKV